MGGLIDGYVGVARCGFCLTMYVFLFLWFGDRAFGAADDCYRFLFGSRCVLESRNGWSARSQDLRISGMFSPFFF